MSSHLNKTGENECIKCPYCKGYGMVVWKCCITHDEGEPCFLCGGECWIDPNNDTVKQKMEALKAIGALDEPPKQN